MPMSATEAVLRRLLTDTTLTLYHAMIAGNQLPYMDKIRERLASPRPGDWVIEKTTGWRHLGRLMLTRKELLERWPSDTAQDTFFYLEGLDGKLVRWSNCDFQALPTPATTYSELVAEEERERAEWLAAALQRHGLLEAP